MCTAADAAHIVHAVVTRRLQEQHAAAAHGAPPDACDPSLALVNFALEQQQLRGDKADNVTVLTVELAASGSEVPPSAV